MHAYTRKVKSMWITHVKLQFSGMYVWKHCIFQRLSCTFQESRFYFVSIQVTIRPAHFFKRFCAFAVGHFFLSG